MFYEKESFIKKIFSRIFSFKDLIMIVLLLIVLAAGASAYYFYAKYQDLKKNPERLAQDETKMLVGKAGKLIEVPDETPTIATVLDKNKLKDQPFFKNAENGDKILIYMKGKKAILYRPSTNKIIEVMPLAVSGDQSSQQVPSSKVVIYNGSEVAGLASTLEEQLKGKIANIEIIEKKML
jgi:hypothetical protein